MGFRNVPIIRDGGAVMTEEEFYRRMTEAEALLPRRPHYVEGYMRGLRRRYRGPRVGTANEHERWLGYAYDGDETNADRGRGYLDGLQGIGPARPRHQR